MLWKLENEVVCHFIKRNKLYNYRYFEFRKIIMNFIHKSYDQLFSLENIFDAWKKFRRGKSGKKDVMEFELHLEDNLFSLWEDLRCESYRHSCYEYFQIFDNKKRDIYKASVRDRIVHQIVFDYLVSMCDHEFIEDSCASRKNKGQYKAIAVFRYFIRLTLSSGRCFVLKCDIRKYFDNIDQNILSDLILKKISCGKIFAVIEEIIKSYVFSAPGKGIPLGNITSQIFANIYLSVLDEYVKNYLKQRFYVRYSDDFLVISNSKERLETLRDKIVIYAKEKLLLEIPLEKTSIRKIIWGVDFLGHIILPKSALLRNKTKSKMLANINRKNAASYFGMLGHCNSYHLGRKALAMCMERNEKVC